MSRNETTPDPFTYPTMDEELPWQETPDDPDNWRSATDEPDMESES